MPEVDCYVAEVGHGSGQVLSGTSVPSAVGGSDLDVEVLLTEADRVALLRAEARRGLTASPKQLPPKWFYDERGSALFDAITRQPEYYLTRREREILRAHAGDIARATGAATLVELGSGTSEKTRLLLDALRETGTLRRFMPFDVCLPAVADAAAGLRRDYPGLDIKAVVGDFNEHVRFLPRGPDGGPLLVAFLGSTIGNFDADERARFFAALRLVLRPGDWFLLGADLVKSKRRLDAAYNDAAGVTIQFNKNVLRVPQPRSARLLRRRPVRSRRRVRQGARAGRHPAARARRPRGEGPRARPHRALRRRRGDAHRDQHQVHARRAREVPARVRFQAVGVLDRPRPRLLALALARGVARLLRLLRAR